MTPADVYHGRRNDILAQRTVIKFQTLIQGKLQTLRLAETRLIANRQFGAVNFDNIHDVGGNLTSDNDKLKRFGEFPRSTSLDELPELWDIFAGDMSSVGLRPLLIEYLLLYTKHQARRRQVKPGITGWAKDNWEKGDLMRRKIWSRHLEFR